VVVLELDLELTVPLSEPDCHQHHYCYLAGLDPQALELMVWVYCFLEVQAEQVPEREMDRV
jgi:hypothetical protein